ncbi:MAG: hypothetical protein HY332_09935 [Chloroflexi bacterium]|nr:hypothetical protein [Chloroflexota bacterium]
MDAETHADSRNEETPEHQEDTDMVQVMVDRLAQERVPVRELNREQGMSLLDKNARFYLGISGREFLHRWERGEYPDPDADWNVMLVASLMGFVR